MLIAFLQTPSDRRVDKPLAITADIFTYPMNEYISSNMVMVVFNYFSNAYEDNQIFILRYLHSNLATLRTLIEILTNGNAL